MQAARMAESHGPSDNSCAGEVDLASLEHDRLIQWMSIVLVIFPDENAQQHSLAWKSASQPPLGLAPDFQPSR